MYDVIVVGAGPAGATAARICAAAGLHTILIEKETIPRDKPCGGGLSNAALGELDRDLPPELIECQCKGMRAIQHTILTTVKRDHTVATMITRRNFDAWLVQQASEAGAEICQGEPCRTVQREKDGVLVTTAKRELRGQLVIGCDGVYSRVARLVRPPWTRKELRFCLIAAVSRASPGLSPDTEELVELRYGYIRQGYAWRFPKKNHISFGIGGSRKQAATLSDSFASYLRLHGIEKSPSFQGCFIPITHFQGDVVAHRIMLCGDAAGFVDAFSGEGIRYALASGKLAGRTAVQSCRKQDYSRSFLMAYQKTFLKTYKTDLIWSARLSSLSSSFPRLILGPLLGDSKTILRYFRVMDGELRFIRFVWGVLLRMPWLMIRSLCPREKKT